MLEILKSTEAKAVIIVSTILAISLLGIDIRPVKGFRINDRTIHLLKGREKIAASALFRIFKKQAEESGKQAIKLLYENQQIVLNPPIEEMKNITVPDFYFQINGIHVFIEIGARNNSNHHKNEQLAVVRKGLSTEGPKHRIIYVQLNSHEVGELSNIRNLKALFEFINIRSRKAVNCRL